MKEDFLAQRLQQRQAEGGLRQLMLPAGKIDFCSNDYLGFARRGHIAAGASGSTGSRLLTGNSLQAEELEKTIAGFHEAEAALLFNSGYDANLALLSALPVKGDRVLYDRLIHASVRDGLRLGHATAHGYAHNDLADLEKKLQLRGDGQCFVVTESVFSMDGDLAPLANIAELCDRYGALLIVDEAHGLGVIGDRGEGLAQSAGLAHRCFARLYTFGKAAGAHGAAVAGSALLKTYLLNTARSLVFTTALPPVALSAIAAAYGAFAGAVEERAKLRLLAERFQSAVLPLPKLVSLSPIQGVLVPGNEAVLALAAAVQERGVDLRPIRYPTVSRGAERLRIVLHAFNTVDELDGLIAALQSYSPEKAE